MKQAVEILKDLKYKLQIFGIDITENETKPLGNNNSVILN